MKKETVPGGIHPIGEPPDGKQFIFDIQEAADLLGIPASEVIKLSRSGRLLFRYTGERYRTRQADIDSYKREREQKQ